MVDCFLILLDEIITTVQDRRLTRAHFLYNLALFMQDPFHATPFHNVNVLSGYAEQCLPENHSAPTLEEIADELDRFDPKANARKGGCAFC